MKKIEGGLAALVAAGAVAVAPAAYADMTMSGHYIWTTTNPSGRSSSGDFYFTPCGDGCASVASAPGGPAFGRARLVNGRWTLDGTWPIRCSDGTSAAEQYHDWWDPNTLTGSEVWSYGVPACGQPAGHQQINALVLGIGSY
jgi:hypothetical protein